MYNVIYLISNSYNSDPKRHLTTVTQNIKKTKEYVTILSQNLIKNPTSVKNVIYTSKLFTIQLASTNINEINKKESIKTGISSIDITNCENLIRSKGLIAQDESLYYSKIDWNPLILQSKSTPYTIDGIAKTISVSYDMFKINGEFIDPRICAYSVQTVVQIPTIYLSRFDLNRYQEYNKKGFNIYDQDDAFYNSRCEIVGLNDKYNSILSRRLSFDGYVLKCSFGCRLVSIDNPQGYMTCDCETFITTNTAANLTGAFSATGLEIGTIIGNGFNLPDIFISNIEIFKCFKTVSIVISLLNTYIIFTLYLLAPNILHSRELSSIINYRFIRFFPNNFYLL